MQRPLANSYWVLPGRFLAGEYPSGREAPDSDAGRARIARLVAAGISCIMPAEETSEMQFRRVLEVNLLGPFLLAKMPPGRYSISADSDGTVKRQTIQVTGTISHRIVLLW